MPDTKAGNKTPPSYRSSGWPSCLDQNYNYKSSYTSTSHQPPPPVVKLFNHLEIKFNLYNCFCRFHQENLSFLKQMDTLELRQLMILWPKLMMPQLRGKQEDAYPTSPASDQDRCDSIHQNTK